MLKKPIPIARVFSLGDLVVLSITAVVLFGLISIARQWTGQFQPVVDIDLSIAALPKYAGFSLTRAVASYFLSLVFSLIYGYAAAKLPKLEHLLIPLLDIFQCIPVLGFLPGLVLGLMTVFPNSNLGLELACIIMIFTGQAWNMTFSFYASIKSVPVELKEACQMMRLTWFQRLLRLELPFSAIGLAWNSLMSMAGGWFFLTVCESFTLGDKQFRLPGIGAYMAVAFEKSDYLAMGMGILAMFLMIIIVDMLIWRPVMMWARKFQMEPGIEDPSDIPLVTTLFRNAGILRRLQRMSLKWARGRQNKTYAKRRKKFLKKLYQQQRQTEFLDVIPTTDLQQKLRGFYRSTKLNSLFKKSIALDLPSNIALIASIVMILWGITRVWELVRTLDSPQWMLIWKSIGATFLHVLAAIVLGSLWTIPVGIVIGLNKKLVRIFQPIVQVTASFPAPMIYPLALLGFQRLGFVSPLHAHWIAVVFMVLGVQWYILFNVLAGTSSISRELQEMADHIRLTRWDRWKKIYLPCVFPSLVTGWITAAGGAWNACIVAEFLQYNELRFMAPGIGSLISTATARADFPVLGGSLLVMVFVVVLMNRTVWRWLYNEAEKKFQFER